MKKAAAARAPPRPIQIRAQTSATEAATASSTGSSTRRNWGTPKSNSAWKVDSPISRPPIRPTRRSRTIKAGSVGGGSVADPWEPRARIPSTSSTAWPIRVIPAPPISIRWVGPQRVTSWPNSRCQRSSSGKPTRAKAPQAAIRSPPTGAYQSPAMLDGGRAGALLRQADREVAGAEDAEEAGEDQVVGGVGERARVATGVDVERDVPVHPEQGDQEGCGRQRRGQGRPAGEAGDSLGEVGGAAEVGDPAAAMAHPEPGDRGAQHQGGAGGDHHLVEGGAAGGLARGEEGIDERGWRRSRSLALPGINPCTGQCNII